MLPTIPREMWRKSGQWITLTRKHAELVVQDHSVASEFEEHCELEANEHYFGVVLAVHGLENETTCSSNAMSCLWPWQTGLLNNAVAPNTIASFNGIGIVRMQEDLKAAPDLSCLRQGICTHLRHPSDRDNIRTHTCLLVNAFESCIRPAPHRQKNCQYPCAS